MSRRVRDYEGLCILKRFLGCSVERLDWEVTRMEERNQVRLFQSYQMIGDDGLLGGGGQKRGRSACT